MVKEKIIIPLDVSTPDEAREIIGELKSDVGAFKIGLQLFTSTGASFVRELVDEGLKIFLDLKFHDIPNTVARASIEVARMGVWMFNLHTLGGPEMLKNSVNEVNEFCYKENLNKPKIIGVTVLTSSNGESLKMTGINTNIEELVANLAEISRENGLDGVVASPHEIRIIRDRIVSKNFLVVTPGIRPQNATFDDQKRVMTPIQAINLGADFLVVGRPVTRATDRIEALRKIIEEIS